jgi:predicted alpha/beta hydrolase
VRDGAHGAAIGHMGYFRPHATRLWDDALAWLAAPHG